jgi:hypothetical protein
MMNKPAGRNELGQAMQKANAKHEELRARGLPTEIPTHHAAPAKGHVWNRTNS